MTSKMPPVDGQTVHTRASLVDGLQQGDEDRWHEFHRLYGPVIRAFALKAGLNETEADEVVQETCIGLAKNVGEFKYDPAKCRFKTWLLNLAAWRVKNQFAKRKSWDERVHSAAPERNDDRTATIERAPDGKSFELLWDEQWRHNLMERAVQEIRGRFSPTHFQSFDLNVLKEWPAGDVAKALGISVASVYLSKHRVSAALKKIITRLERENERV
jgi:RNA polymerase sigma factor (sigma-70 family)